MLSLSRVQELRASPVAYEGSVKPRVAVSFHARFTRRLRASGHGIPAAFYRPVLGSRMLCRVRIMVDPPAATVESLSRRSL